jgi:hypothetical protein
MAILERHTIVPRLSGPNLRTYEAVFRHPLAHNLEWGAVRQLLEAVAEVKAGHNGHILGVRQGRTLHLPDHPGHTTVSQPDVKRIREFLEQTELPADPNPAADGHHWLVVVDHAAARIYRTEMHGAEPIRIEPHDPEGRGRLVHPFTEDGKHRPVRKEFYESIADVLRGAGRVLIFGHGTGESSAMDELYADLCRWHPDLADRIVGRVTIDPHTTEDQLLARARVFYSIHQDRSNSNR